MDEYPHIGVPIQTDTTTIALGLFVAFVFGTIAGPAWNELGKVLRDSLIKATS